MSKIFYDHLIIIEEITLVLDKHNLNIKERQEILNYVDQSMHHHILDTILTHLPKHHHEQFLSKFHAAPHDTKLIEFIKEKVNIDIEKEILKVANKVKKEVIKLIKKSK